MSNQVGPLYFCIHVPEFPTQARLRYRPQHLSAPIAILDGAAPLEQVISATSKALQQGVSYGMTRIELDSFPGVITMPRSQAEERAARTALAELAGMFTPSMQTLAHTAGACTLVLDMAGTQALFGSPQQVLAQIQNELKRLSMYARIAASCNFHTAVCAAPYATRKGSLIAEGEERAALRNLPLAAVRPTEQQAGTFALWGLHTCGDLAEIPEVGLIARLGQPGKDLRLLARGEQTHLLIPEVEPFTLQEHLTLDSPVDLLDYLLAAIRPMLDQLIARAGARSLALASVTVSLRLDGTAPQDSSEAVAETREHVRIVKPALPQTDGGMLMKLIHLDLQAHPPPAAVHALHVRAEPGDQGTVQLGLFSPQTPEPTRLDVTLARIAAMVGEHQVGRAKVQDVHMPDSFLIERFTLGTQPCTLPNYKESTSVALRRFRPSILLHLQTENSRPADFYLDGRKYVVDTAHGPWRLSGNWWSQAIWSRDEWDVHAVTSNGDEILGLIMHDLLQDNWHLEAIYD